MKNKTPEQEPDWKTMALDALKALRLLNAHYEDLSKGNPGFLGRVVLQNYALLNEALIASDRTLTKYQNIPTENTP